MTNTQNEIAAMIAESLAGWRPWHKSDAAVAEILMARNAQRAVAGKASPVAGRVLARLLAK